MTTPEESPAAPHCRDCQVGHERTQNIALRLEERLARVSDRQDARQDEYETLRAHVIDLKGDFQGMQHQIVITVQELHRDLIMARGPEKKAKRLLTSRAQKTLTAGFWVSLGLTLLFELLSSHFLH